MRNKKEMHFSFMETFKICVLKSFWLWKCAKMKAKDAKKGWKSDKNAQLWRLLCPPLPPFPSPFVKFLPWFLHYVTSCCWWWRQKWNFTVFHIKYFRSQRILMFICWSTSCISYFGAPKFIVFLHEAANFDAQKLTLWQSTAPFSPMLWTN